MKVTPDTVKAMAELAKLGVALEDLDMLTERFNEVLKLFDELSCTPTDTVDPLAHPLDATQPLRSDTVTESDQRTSMQSVAPAVDRGHYLVPRVVD
ncbi:MAG: Asp-tRNA(Asn)/Glu-tRNA(Gln) amidotransferase subunit GatC [Pseudomonadota bacterium]